MKFGIFDHVDVSGLPLAELFNDRLEYVAAADEAGFYCYHVAEHHATPLNMVPVPGVYLGAVARATKRMRLGPLVYLLPLYSPLRLIEEIAILDHLSQGRFDVGVGRGVSPFELNFHNIDPETSREVFMEAHDAVINGLTNDKLNHSGKHFSYTDVPMELKPLQQPHPPVWYASTNVTGAVWGGEQGTNFVTLGAMELAKSCIDTFKEALEKRGGPAIPNPEFEGGTAIGIMRQMVLAETDDEAVALFRPAYRQWIDSLTKLQRAAGVQGPRFASAIILDPDEALEKGAVIVDSPETAGATIERQSAELGLNYMIFEAYFGDLAHAKVLRSIDLFTTEIMPQFA